MCGVNCSRRTTANVWTGRPAIPPPKLGRRPLFSRPRRLYGADRRRWGLPACALRDVRSCFKAPPLDDGVEHTAELHEDRTVLGAGPHRRVDLTLGVSREHDELCRGRACIPDEIWE